MSTKKAVWKILLLMAVASMLFSACAPAAPTTAPAAAPTTAPAAAPTTAPAAAPTTAPAAAPTTAPAAKTFKIAFVGALVHPYYNPIPGALKDAERDFNTGPIEWQMPQKFDQTVQNVLTTDQLLALQKEADKVYVDPALIEYTVRMVTATRTPKEVGLPELEKYIMFGASPRASINLILTGRGLAFVRGRNYALPQDVLDMALDVMRHRIVLSYEALSDNVTGDDILKKILDRIPIPVVPLHEHADVRSNT